MLTIADIKEKAARFADDQPAEELLNELLLHYKVEKGVLEADAGKGVSLDVFNKEMEAWWTSK